MLPKWHYTVTLTSPHVVTATIKRRDNEHKPYIGAYDVNGTITATGRDSAEAVARLSELVNE